MKKLYIIPAAVVILITLMFAGCKKEGEFDELSTDVTESAAVVYQTDANGETVTDDEGNPVAEETAATAEPAPTSATDAQGNEIPPPPSYPLTKTVGFVYRGVVRGNPENEIFEASRAKLEVDLAVDTYYVDNVLVQTYNDAVDALMKKGCDVIVSCSESFSNAAAKLAKTLPNVDFINFGGALKSSNLGSIEPLLYQGANIAGLAAAYSSESNIIGIVADRSMPQYAAVVDSFVLGAKIVQGSNTNIKLNVCLSEDEARTKNAIDDLRQQGCDTIFVYQNDIFGIQYCEKVGVKVAAFAANLPELAPTQYVMGFFFDITSFLNESVRYIQNDAFYGKTEVGSLYSRSIRMTKLSELSPPETATLVDELVKNVSAQQGDGIFRGELKDISNVTKVSKGDILPFSESVNIDWLVRGITRVKKYDRPKGDEDLVYPTLEVKS